MRTFLLTSGIVLSLILIQLLNCSGAGNPGQSCVPLNFGTDVVAHYSPDNADLDCNVAVAFNGWIYIAYSTSHSGPPGTDIGLVLSKDNGVTWQAFPPIIFGSHNGASVYDLLVTGTDTSSLRVYLSYYFYDVAFPYSFCHVVVYDGISGSVLPYGVDIGDGTYNIGEVRLASDYRHPAFGSTGYSVAIVYTTSQGDFTATDSLVCLISSDTGSSNYNYNLLDTSSLVSIRGASIDYGFSLTWNKGRYFIAYQRGLYLGYCRNSSSITSGFTTPILLNSIIGFGGNSFGSPKIVCQNSFGINDSSGLSVMIMTKALDSMGTNTYRIPWLIYNMQAALSDYWFSAGVVNSLNGFSLETFDACYSESEDRFFLAGYNSDSGSLFTRLEDFNFSHLGNWFLVDSQYNDTLIDPALPPNPRITTNGDFVYTAWESRTFGFAGQPRSQTLFDKQALPIITTVQTLNETPIYRIYPNPANNELIIYAPSSLIREKEKVVSLYDNLGRIVFFKKYSSGVQSISVNTMELKNGIYFLHVAGENLNPVIGKILIQHD